MKFLFTAIFLIFSSFGFTQTSTYQGNCCDNNGKPSDPSELSTPLYVVKKHKKKIAIELNIESIKFGDQIITTNTSFSKKLHSETPVIELNEVLGVKLVIARANENGQNYYLYKLHVYQKDTDSDCWRSLGVFNTFYEVYQQSFSLNQYAVGYPESENYFQIQKGYIRLN